MTTPADRIPLPQVRDLLRVGYALPFRVLDATARLLLNQGHVLVDEAQYEALLERGAWAERALVEAERKARADSVRNAATEHALSLFDHWERVVGRFDRLARAIVKRQQSALAIVPFFESLRQLVDCDPDVALFMCMRPAERRFALYPLTHSIHCAVASLLAARTLKWSVSQVTSLGCAALTMNISQFELQALMAAEDSPPTARQLKEIRGHPEASVALLRAGGVDDEAWLVAVAQHHERAGGAGYPQGLETVVEAAQLLRAADTYMAKMSTRVGRPALTPQTATRQLFQQRPGDPVAMAMVRTLGVYPPGSLLKLQSGEVAVAIRRPAAGTHPLVATLSDAKGRPTGQTQVRNTAEPAFAAVGPFEATKEFARVLPERVYGLVPVDDTVRLALA